jgi:hypothetical protein
MMRTTLDIDPDILAAAKEISHRTRRSAGRVISDLARKALSAESPPPRSKGAVVNGFETIPAAGRVVTPDLVSTLLEEDVS